MKKRQILNIILKPGTEISLEETTAISELIGLDKCSSIVLQCWATYEILNCLVATLKVKRKQVKLFNLIYLNIILKLLARYSVFYFCTKFSKFSLYFMLMVAFHLD